MSALIQMRDSNGKFIQARALLGTCATANFITENLTNRLKLPTQTCSIPIGAVNGMQTFSKHLIQVVCKSLNNKFQKSLSFLTVNKITDLSPNEVFPRDKIDIPNNIALADPLFHLPRPVDVLIGSGTTLALLSIGQINRSQEDYDLVIQKTQLGWVVAGGVNEGNNTQPLLCQLLDLSNQLTRFWIIEDVSPKGSRTLDDSLCETHYQLNTTRDANGRYIVKLPFKVENVEFGNSKQQAYKRFLSLQRRLNVDQQLKIEYNKVMQEYIDLGHMVLVSHD
ncbi:uncharacterized protein LOC123258929 [Cotesia glomerata]|uniref:uncharacterized protein LOC123258929 n=1 Tax=Cotesia glomerata TaxID=32391 RepID=UPI001D02F02D|nr:uncharacterized protein LOC123258929 [Cotesia glomerata]